MVFIPLASSHNATKIGCFFEIRDQQTLACEPNPAHHLLYGLYAAYVFKWLKFSPNQYYFIVHENSDFHNY
jgi:hypothetical protein